ncbi:SRPBCC family protein [Planococcus sp. CP5-4]|uniref:SRPBCC family protein n=1 Tax=unclassified Planococcus (in: firmicutes) TaxID=2662419 RepID=UPI001C24D908|nr:MULTISPECIES: SRPBCC family protein [unclassified Planococcus (in: firmicutes)]MBU9674376.1 SRPBCC family protein [Planococcus sp. CP5-4_YE]MBV0909036.1 SRPBCC family protein [Planococcus sp. CP5-4_UN]MBW6065068.1 SRPBCC family protein [Planococcus sp. CP5-4]
MVKWKEQLVIEAPIDRVWELFQDEEIQRIMPKVESHDLLEGENNAAGAKHAQVYTEGKQQQRYIVETLSYVDEPERKYKETAFEMGQMFKVRYAFSLEKESAQSTRFVYEGQNKGMSVTGKMMLLAGSKKAARNTVLNFMNRVKEQAESYE